MPPFLSISNSLTLFLLIPEPSHSEWLEFRDCCDLIVSPDDMEISRYPTLSVNGGSGEPELQVTVRNAGAVASGSFDVSLEIVYEEELWTSSARCTGLDPGEEETLQFVWHDPPSGVSGEIHLSAEADPLPGQLVVYDISGHIVRVLYGNGGNSFPWDGCDSEGNELSGVKELSEDNLVIPLFAGSEENAF